MKKSNPAKQKKMLIVVFLAEFERDQEEALKNIKVGDEITFEGTCYSAGSWSDCELIN